MKTDKDLTVCASPFFCFPAIIVALVFTAILALISASSASAVVYVDKNAAGANNGTSWADAYKLIQLGIDDAAARGGDEVWVTDGIYFEAIVMKSGVKMYGGFNGIETERSERNWRMNETLIDASPPRGGSPTYHAVTMDSVTSSTIDGFTITGGNATGSTDPNKVGGGIYCLNLDHTSAVSNNTITGNSAYYGGGISCIQSSAAITNNTISENSASNGGGIYCQQSSPTIINNTISENSVSEYGGGIYCILSSAEIKNNIIAGNFPSSQYGSGAGISCLFSSAIITNNAILRNWNDGISCNQSSPLIAYNVITGNSTGGISCGNNSSPIITNNTIAGNLAQGGGGISCSNLSWPVITNNTIAGNSAYYRGGGIDCYQCSPTIGNNTIAGNSAYGPYSRGGGIHCQYNSSPRIKNNIFSNNDKYDIYESGWNSDPPVSYNDFYGNTDGVYYDEGTTPSTNVSEMDSAIPECSNNIGLDPLFVGRTLSGGTWTAEADYHSDTFQTTLTDSSASWAENEHAGRLLNPDTTQNRQFVIVGNTTTTIAVWCDVTDITQIGHRYRIFDYHLQNVYDAYPADSPCIDAGDPTDDYSNEPVPNGDRINQGRYGNTPEAARSTFVTPTPIPTPTAIPTYTPTPTPTPTPSTAELVTQYAFEQDLEGWSFLPIHGPWFSGAWSSYSGGRLAISTPNDSESRVGAWNGPLDIPYEPDTVYRARYVVSSSQAVASANPQLRMRWTHDGALESASHIVNASISYSHSLPSYPVTKEYCCYIAPAVSGDLGVAFDMLDFDIATYATHYVDTVTIERFPRPSTGVVVKTYDNAADFANWGFMTNVGFGPVTSDGSGTGTLCLTSGVDNYANYGVWQSSGVANELTYEEDKLYRTIFTLRCESEAARNIMPQIRLRCQNEDGQFTQTMELNSQGIGPGAMPPVSGTAYEVYWETPTLPSSPGRTQDGFIVAIDMLDFDPNKGGTICLDSVTVDYLEIP